MKDWDSLFGDVPESFSRRVRDTVDRLERQESAPARPSFRLRPVAVLALALCLLAGTAAALSGLGVLDTLGRELRACCIDEDALATTGYFFTHMKQDEWAIGRKAAELILQLLGGKKLPQQNIRVPAVFHQGQTT